MKFKRVLRVHPEARIFRLFRVMWVRGKVGDGNGYSSKLSVGLRPRFLEVRREWDGWIVTILGLRIHKKRSYGGIHV